MTMGMRSFALPCCKLERRASFTMLVVGALAAFSLTAAAQAAVVTFVASMGNDANPCTRTSPCRNIQRAVDVTNAGGEVQILDSGLYKNLVTIQKSITISAEGVSATLGSIVINKLSAVVTLRGLLLNGTGVSTDGITVTKAKAVHIEHCEIQRFPNGVNVVAAAKLFINDTAVRANAGDGVFVGSGANAKVIIENSRFEGNGIDGVQVTGSETSIARSIFSGNAASGLVQVDGTADVAWTVLSENGSNAVALGGSFTEFSIESSVLRGNSAGISVGAGVDEVRLSNTVITHNDTGIFGSGTVHTRENNTIEDNGTNVSGVTLTPFAAK